MFHTFNNVQIDALIGVSGTTIIDVEETGNKYGIDSKKTKRLIKTMGFEKLRLLPKPLTVSDMSIEGAKECLKKTNTNPNEIDALIFVSQSADYIVPATTYRMQEKLGLKEDVIMLDLQQGCSGFVYGLFYASTLISSNSCKKVLVCVGDLTSLDTGCFNSQPSNSLLFGDGCGVALLSKSENCMSSYLIKSHGSKSNVIINPMSGWRYLRGNADNLPTTTFLIDGTALADYEITEGIDCINNLLERTNLSLNDLSYILIHQSNKTIIKTMASLLNIDSYKMPFLASNTGNTSSASIPLGISENLLVLDKLREAKVLLSGIGVGLSCANAIVDLTKTTLLPPIYL